MPMPTDMSGGVRRLPADYQESGMPDGEDFVAPEMEDADSKAMWEIRVAQELEELETATLENWLLDDTPIESYVRLRTRPLKVKIKAMTEEERRNIERRAPKKPNKQTKKLEPDPNWTQLELVRAALVEPHISDPELLLKALAGDLAHLAGEIGKLSGFDMGTDDALE